MVTFIARMIRKMFCSSYSIDCYTGNKPLKNESFNIESESIRIKKLFREYSIQYLKEILDAENFNSTNRHRYSEIPLFQMNRGCLNLATTNAGLKEFEEKYKNAHFTQPQLNDGKGKKENDAVFSCSDDSGTSKSGYKNLSNTEGNCHLETIEACSLRYPLLSASLLPYKTCEVYGNVGSIDVFSMVRTLEKICREKYNVQFAYEVKVSGFTESRQKYNKNRVITGLITSIGEIPVTPIVNLQSDGYSKQTSDISYSPVILANGAWIPKLTATLGIYTPIYPIKGITLFFQQSKESLLPDFFTSKANVKTAIRIGDSLVDHEYGKSEFDSQAFRLLFKTPSEKEKHINRTPVYRDRILWLNHTVNALTVSAFSELGGWKLAANNRMKIGLVERVKLIYPRLFQEEKGRCAVISGLRPLTFDNNPIIGKLHSSYDNVFVNGGGGYEGFALAAGSGYLIANIVTDSVLNSIDSLPRHHAKPDYSFQAFRAASESDIVQMKRLFQPLHRIQYSPYFSRLCLRRWKD